MLQNIYFWKSFENYIYFFNIKNKSYKFIGFNTNK